MLKLDAGSLAFSAAVASVVSALIIGTINSWERDRRSALLFAGAMALFGVGSLIALSNDSRISVAPFIVGNSVTFASVLLLHAGTCSLVGRRPPLVGYMLYATIYVAAYLLLVRLPGEANLRIAVVSLLRMPILLHAALILGRSDIWRRSRGITLLIVIYVGWCLTLLIRGLVAAFIDSPMVTFNSLLGGQTFYFIVLGLGNVGIASALLLIEGQNRADDLEHQVIAKTELLRRREMELRLIHDAATVAICFIDAQGIIQQANQFMADLFQDPLNELIGRHYLMLVDPEERSVAAEKLTVALTDRDLITDLERRYIRSDQTLFWGHLTARPLIDIQGALTGMVAVIADITERRKTEQRIQFLAHHDPLTGLPNRLLVEDRFLQTLSRAERAKKKAALVFIDLDHFKEVNDSLGHDVGDDLLREVARRLESTLRDTDTISRHGGDEFLIILAEIRDVETITEVVEKVLTQLKQPVVLNGHEITVSSSIGVAVAPDDGRTFESLLKKADTAMYHGKEAGRNTYRFYSEQMNVATLAQIEVRNGLRRALEENGFLIRYQPQVDLASGQLVGAEALLRWQRAEGDEVDPAQFIAIAEESGLILSIGRWVLREALIDLRRWQNAGLSDISMAVNLSPAQFKRGQVGDMVLDVLAETGADARWLELELTELTLLTQGDFVHSVIDRLRREGARFALDDFGTGYAHLGALKDRKLDKLKIDGSIIHGIGSDPHSAAMVRALIDFTHGLGLKAVAEGVERAEELAFLQASGCDLAQGYFLSPPLSGEEFQRFAALQPSARLELEWAKK